MIGSSGTVSRDNLVLPDMENLPSALFDGSVDTSIPCFVVRNLLPPIGFVRFRGLEAFRTGVEEASIDKNRQFFRRERNIYSIPSNLVVQSVPQPFCIKHPPQNQLGLGIFASYPGHDSAADSPGDGVHGTMTSAPE